MANSRPFKLIEVICGVVGRVKVRVEGWAEAWFRVRSGLPLGKQ